VQAGRVQAVECKGFAQLGLSAVSIQLSANGHTKRAIADLLRLKAESFIAGGQPSAFSYQQTAIPSERLLTSYD
jgi:hypothetical protein